MLERRKPEAEVTPAHEDSGIFSARIVLINVDLVPIWGHNTRRDLLIKGYVEGRAIDVVFPGRRYPLAAPLTTHLQALWSRACASARSAGGSADADRVRCRVGVEGSWRPRYSRDDQGWQTCKYQLFAARWMMRDAAGTVMTFGESVQR